jgi:hypothetical protein
MRRVALLTILIVVSTATVGVTAQTAQVTVTNVTVAPEQPSPGERFTVTTTIQNAQSTPNSPSAAFEVNTVSLRRVDGGSERRVTSVDDPGFLPTGGTLEVPLTVSFEETGVKELRVFVVGESRGRVTTLRYPVIVTVREGGPQLSIEAEDAVVGAESPTRVTVANGESASVRNVRLDLQGTDAEVADATRVIPSLSGGAERTFQFNVTPGTTDADVTATLGYTTASGDRRSVSETFPLRTDPLVRDVELQASTSGAGASPEIAVDVSNFGNAPLTDVVVRATQNGTSVARRSVPDVPAETTRDVTLDVGGADNGPVTVRAAYETGGQSGTAETTLEYQQNPGRIQLTGVDYETEGDRLHFSGSASNVGLSPANSVVVRVMPAEGVTPARPNREYFVGTVPESDFVSFDLYARLDGDVSEVPIEVSYIVDGERRRSVERIDVSDVRTAPARGSGGNDGGDGGGGGLGGSLPLLVGGIVAAVLVIAVGAYAYLRR